MYMIAALRFAIFRFAHFAQGIHNDSRILLCKPCKLIFCHSHVQLSNHWMHWLTIVT